MNSGAQKHENTEALEYEWAGILPYEFSVDQDKINVILDASGSVDSRLYIARSAHNAVY